mgnify:CR=1 FL=1
MTVIVPHCQRTSNPACATKVFPIFPDILLCQSTFFRNLADEFFVVARDAELCGAFLSYAFLLGTLAYGIRLIAVVVPVIMLVVAFVYPLFGKRSHYCMWVCPLGSAQELAGKLNPRHKWKMSAATVHRLEVARDVVWALLMLMLWTGIGFAWVDYELFIAFTCRIAPLGVTAAAGVVLLLSVFVSRPYCRFLCPTGNLIRLAQNESKLIHGRKER